MKVRELVRLLQANGWTEVRQRGSHRIFRHPTNARNISVPDHGLNEPMPKGLEAAILRDAGLK